MDEETDGVDELDKDIFLKQELINKRVLGITNTIPTSINFCLQIISIKKKIKKKSYNL